MTDGASIAFPPRRATMKASMLKVRRPSNLSGRPAIMSSIVPHPPVSLSPGQPQPAFDPDDVPVPNLDDLVTEDGAPVDNFFAEKQYRLLTDPLYTSWTAPGEGGRFIAATDV